MCIALAVFSVLDTTAKYMATVAQLPVTQVVWVRFLSQALLIVMVVGVLAVPRSQKKKSCGANDCFRHERSPQAAEIQGAAARGGSVRLRAGGVCGRALRR